MNQENSFAICIPTCGRIEALQTCASSLAGQIQRHPDFEVVVVDNNIDDAYSNQVREVCRYFGIAEKYVREQRPGLSSARHSLLSVTNSNILCYVDDDVIFTHDWFHSIRDTFLDPNVAIAGGPAIPRFHCSIPSWFWDFVSPTPYGGWSNGWLSLLDIGKDVDDIDANWIWGLNFAIRRDVLIDCGGFHIDLVPRQFMRWQGDGETGLTMKLAAKGCKAVYRQNSLLFHQCGSERLNPAYFAKRAYYQGICNSFTELRMRLKSNAEVAPAASLSQNLLLRAIKKVKISITSKFPLNPSKLQTQSPWAESASEVRKLCQQAEREGYLFHQHEAAQDPKLRKWICRENYFDIDLRELFAEYQREHAHGNILIND